MQNLESCKQNLEWSGSCDECHNCHIWEKQLKSKRVRMPLLRWGADTAAQMNMFSLWWNKNVQKVSLFSCWGVVWLGFEPNHCLATVHCLLCCHSL